MQLMDQVNQAWYARREAVEAFARDDLLEPALVMLLVRFRDLIVGKDVLDLGVGAGRTTRYLSALTSRYVGIDYSEAMVDLASTRFPDSRIEWGDARDLSRFATSSFDFILFSAAGIDTLDHEARVSAMREASRVLRPGGAFVFSTHNRDYVRRHAGPRLETSRNPVTLLANTARWAYAIRNHARMTRMETESERYELVNDSADGYRLLHYYIRPADQRVQLADAGLQLECLFDDMARDVPLDGTAPNSPWLWYVARAPMPLAATGERRRFERRAGGIARRPRLAEQRG